MLQKSKVICTQENCVVFFIQAKKEDRKNDDRTRINMVAERRHNKDKDDIAMKD